MGAVIDLAMPKLGLTMVEGTVAQWLVPVGSRFAKDQILAVIETDKIANDLEAPGDGTMVAQLIAEGDSAEVGQTIGRVELDGDATPSPAPSIRDAEPQAVLETPAASREQEAEAAQIPVGPKGERIVATPYARRIAGEAGIDLTAVDGTGIDGRIVAADIANAQRSGAKAALLPGAAALTFVAREIELESLLGLIDTLADAGNAGLTPIHALALAAARTIGNLPLVAKTSIAAHTPWHAIGPLLARMTQIAASLAGDADGNTAGAVAVVDLTASATTMAVPQHPAGAAAQFCLCGIVTRPAIIGGALTERRHALLTLTVDPSLIDRDPSDLLASIAEYFDKPLLLLC